MEERRVFWGGDLSWTMGGIDKFPNCCRSSTPTSDMLDSIQLAQRQKPSSGENASSQTQVAQTPVVSPDRSSFFSDCCPSTSIVKDSSSEVEVNISPDESHEENRKHVAEDLFCCFSFATGCRARCLALERSNSTRLFSPPATRVQPSMWMAHSYLESGMIMTCSEPQTD